MNLTPFLFHSWLFVNPGFALSQLRQGGEGIKIIGHIRVVDGAIVFCHSKGAVTQQLLENQRITATVHKELSGKGMPEKVDAGSLDTALMVVLLDRAGEGVL